MRQEVDSRDEVRDAQRNERLVILREDVGGRESGSYMANVSTKAISVIHVGCFGEPLSSTFQGMWPSLTSEKLLNQLTS